MKFGGGLNFKAMKKYWWKYDNTREYNSRGGASSRAKGWTSPVCGSMNKKNKEDAPLI